jgi:hypothetical protein
MSKTSNGRIEPVVGWQPTVKVSTVLQMVAVAAVALCIGLSIGATLTSSDMVKVGISRIHNHD